MSVQNRLIRELLLYELQLDHTAAEAIRNICAAKGEGAVKKSTASDWFRKFKNGDTNFEDQPRSGRPFSIDPEALRQAVEADPATSTCKLSAKFGTSNSTIYEHLHHLGKVSRSCRNVPHELTPEQAQYRVNVCKELLANPRNERFIKRIVTCDEK
ncbi:unnamed protein product [Didymodactylos carnosus]|uniref:Mos1 transposase HTH domain-containing protein n=1 Tax=Didymodactylos carnosus TaxID=1234261 RepID=A0A814E0Y3_9BILA|nr:unnamed protein product [Didymodactylos carnosus]CAF0961637.1 unnamed protein product [Didymodactylos carnosus]CAF3601611.1 unnamed protein product [Didymodactylos carnosus]CAF3736109.1 unnamed protein product [Didymodactylos carnosus]